MPYSPRKPFLVRTQLDGSYLYIKKEERRREWWEDGFFTRQPRTPTHFEDRTTLTPHAFEAAFFTENTAKAAKKRANKRYADIICETERNGRLQFEVVNVSDIERK